MHLFTCIWEVCLAGCYPLCAPIKQSLFACVCVCQICSCELYNIGLICANKNCIISKAHLPVVPVHVHLMSLMPKLTLSYSAHVLAFVSTFHTLGLVYMTSQCFVYFSFRPLKRPSLTVDFFLTIKQHCLEQGWANCGLGAIWGPLGFLIQS